MQCTHGGACVLWNLSIFAECIQDLDQDWDWDRDSDQSLEYRTAVMQTVTLKNLLHANQNNDKHSLLIRIYYTLYSFC